MMMKLDPKTEDLGGILLQVASILKDRSETQVLEARLLQIIGKELQTQLSAKRANRLHVDPNYQKLRTKLSNLLA